MRYSEFQLHAWSEGVGRVQVLVTSSPAGSLRRPATTAADPGRLDDARTIAALRRPWDPGTRDRICQMGRMLSEVLMPEEVSELFSGSVNQLEPGEGLRIRLCLDEDLVDLP
jgi:hypothetical protein